MGAEKLGVIDVPANCKIYTPIPLAHGIVTALGDTPSCTWLEPGFGQGVFLEALSSIGVSKKRIVAVDLDREAGPYDSFAHVHRGVEFLEWSRETSIKFDRIVGNPPYVPMARLPSSLRKTSEQIPLPYNGSRPNGSSNLWFFFLCASISLLKKGGSIGLVLPAAWEYADYAEELRQSMASNFGQCSLVRSRKPLFTNVQDGSVVLLARGYGKASHRKTRRYVCADIDAAVKILEKLDSKADKSRLMHSRSQASCTRLLGEFVHIGIGAVTGDARYFLMNETRRKRLSLPVSSCRPALTRACHLTQPLMTRLDWENLRNIDERIWLFRPPKRFLNHFAVKSYLDLVKKDGGCNISASHVSRRPLWHETILPTGVHGYISGMSTIGPCIIFNDMPGLIATNTLYVVTFRRNVTKTDRFVVALGLLSSQTRADLNGVCRVYADGLRKYEPSDLMSIPIPTASHCRGAKGAYRKATQALFAGDAVAALEISDAFFADRG